MREKHADFYQTTLIILAVAVTGLFGVFVLRELFPEYKEYQNRYEELEEMRSEYTGVAPAPFKSGVKQIVIAQPDKGPETIDRCVSCHVSMKLPHFSPTKIAYDVNGNLVVDDEGIPVKVPNDEYVWGRIDDQIAELTDSKLLAQLEANGDLDEVKRRQAEAEELEALKHLETGHHHYDMTKVLAMHPLIGRETAPFQYHSMDDFGCTSCHSGNGRGLTTPKAHGPVLDGQYHAAAHGPTPKFLEEDPDNDPHFAKVFNHKPGHDLLFQTTPILTGSLIEARCVQCHQPSGDSMRHLVDSVDRLGAQKEQLVASLQKGIKSDEASISSLLGLHASLKAQGYEKTLAQVRAGLNDLRLTPDNEERLEGHLVYLEQSVSSLKGDGEALDRRRADHILARINDDLSLLLGSQDVVESLTADSVWERSKRDQLVQAQIAANPGSGALKSKIDRLSVVRGELEHLNYNTESLQGLASGASLGLETDKSLASYHRGRQLFMSQACYACHKVSGMSRGGVGPELTLIGLQYPWYIKESIVWPQADLATSTMPNLKLDHDELEDLMTFLMAQRGESQTMSEVAKAETLKAWEAGSLMPWEESIPAAEIQDTRKGRIVFATEGCASCHKLRGFSSDVGFLAEKSGVTTEELLEEREWLRKVIPEYISGSQIVAALEEHGEEIDSRIVRGVHDDKLLEEIDGLLPDGVIANISPFRFAQRAKNTELKDNPQALAAWQERVHRVMMAYVQEYGLGRDIGPHLHWSGVYRDEQWLVEHFRKPTMHVAKSIMPTLPFDDTKFYQLTYMLQEAAKENRDIDREQVNLRGFDPEHAYNENCASCHGAYLHGNGPIARWIYPIPKNLRNPTFMRNLTRERAIASIVHGVQGTPMPPWGQDVLREDGDNRPVLTQNEIEQLVDWLYLALPGGRVIEGEKDVPKWQYTPDDFLQELELQSAVPAASDDRLSNVQKGYLESVLPSAEGYQASLTPVAGHEEQKGASRIFDKVENPEGSLEPYSYYLKREFFTEENIHAGERLFLANCAHCHGKEGAGNGNRATTMVDAKPRMLTNLPWLKTRDDLRILRSIKYGVAGTSMTPWGDKTDAWQRLQMVTYIRSLTAAKDARTSLSDVLYRNFEVAVRTIEQVEVSLSQQAEKLRAYYERARQERENSSLAVREGKSDADRASAAYAAELQAMSRLEQSEEVVTNLARLKEEIAREQKLYRDLGASLVDWGSHKPVFHEYLKVLEATGGRYKLDREVLLFKTSVGQERGVRDGVERIDGVLQADYQELDKERTRLTGQHPSAQRTLALQELDQKAAAITKLRRNLLSTFQLAQESRRRQQELYDAYSKSHRE